MNNEEKEKKMDEENGESKFNALIELTSNMPDMRRTCNTNLFRRYDIWEDMQLAYMENNRE